ncbi:MBL fold metallo-hydrolase [Paenibacillus wynnii]|uniref:MBL fold metallo-hydrolase n=1 Tax=Paenibacillus wynnii TaxID=268407 RepID=UPI002794E977|nr:MBL fold metallo-hydrolase [Paenibacillus wynnii]MDQ0195677.1 L-ascorbate metabolism protein UlaG (beta-lactamase superfamily) [Paenibacillus wynnii]
MEMQFYHVGGACFVLKMDQDLLISCDPALSPEGTEYQFKSFSSVRVRPPIYEQELLDQVNIWLITHVHEDHIDDYGIRSIAEDSTIVTHKKAEALFANHKEVLTVDWNDTKVLNKDGYVIEVTTIPAYHGNNFIMRSMVGRVNGYFIRITKGEEKRTIYITSDTVFHPRIVNMVSELGPIDLMIANLGEVSPDKFGGPLTMSVVMLNRMVEQLKPSTVIPIHINDFSHYTTTEDQVTGMGFNVVDQGLWIKVS